MHSFRTRDRMHLRGHSFSLHKKEKRQTMIDKNDFRKKVNRLEAILCGFLDVDEPEVFIAASLKPIIVALVSLSHSQESYKKLSIKFSQDL